MDFKRGIFFPIVAIHTRNHITVQSGPDRCRNRSVDYLLFVCHINRRPVHNAIYAEYSAATSQNLIVTAHRQWSTGVDT